MSYYAVQYVATRIIGVVTPNQIIDRNQDIWMIKTGKAKNANTYAAKPLGGGPYKTRAEALVQGFST